MVLLEALQNIPVQTSPIQLGPTGTIILTIACIVLGFLALRQRNWKTASDAANAELEIQRAAATRLREEKITIMKEKEELVIENARLHTQTNLQPLVSSITDWITEGRKRFDAATAQLTGVQLAQARGMKELFAEVSSHRQMSEDAFKTYTTIFMQHTEEDKIAWTKLLGMFAVLDERLSETAIAVGKVDWKSVTMKRGKDRSVPVREPS